VHLVIVRGDRPILAPGSLPVVVCAVGDEFGGQGPDGADLVVGEQDLDELIDAITTRPIAARTLAVLLRAIPAVSIDVGLTLESAAYSMLQAGPEFAAWRATRSSQRPASPTTDHTVLVDRHGSSLVITLDRPGRHNAITAQLRDDLHQALAIALVDDSVETVVLRGNGPSFCSGGDLDEFGTRPDPATAHMTRLARSPGRSIGHLGDRTSVFVHGSTLGGGIEMAAFAHRVVADRTTVIGLPEIGLGLIPGAGGTVSITRRIGRQRTAALALSDRRIDAVTALSWGLVDQIDA
jgi:hypothetical protein